MKNLAGESAYWNNIQARKDWRKIADFAHRHGLGDEANALAPANLDMAKWRKIDKQIERLRELAAERGVTIPPAYELSD